VAARHSRRRSLPQWRVASGAISSRCLAIVSRPTAARR
jgi:hypothetical protein